MKNYPQDAGASVQNKNKCGSDVDSAAAPFLQGVKAEPWGWAIPRGGSKKPIILEASKFDQASAAAEADIHDFGYFPIYAQPVSAPAPRAQALEEAARVADDSVRNNQGYDSPEAHAAFTVSREIARYIRALSSQPVADGLPQDVINLVIAAREAFDTGVIPDDEEHNLDKALEPFSERVLYENEPEEDANDV